MTDEKGPTGPHDDERAPVSTDSAGLEEVSEAELVPEDDRVIGVAFRWSVTAIGLVALIVVLVLWLGGEEAPAEIVVERGPVAVPPALPAIDAGRPDIPFTDVTQAAGIDFVHENGARGEKLLPETMGSGAAFFDLEGDGDQDLLLVNGRAWPGDENAEPAIQALYRNDGSGRFEDVTVEAGLDLTLYGTGPAIADHDGDGDPDIFIAALGRNVLLRNDGGVFTDVTDEAGVGGDEDAWSTSAGFFDADGDGDLDLWVTNYVAWTAELDRELAFTLNGRDRAYGPPRLYPATHDVLYRNDGDGRFTDVSEQAGIRVTNAATGEAVGKGLAVTFVDVDDDGALDVFVANDTVRNFLFRNRGDATFEDVSIRSGVAFDDVGAATGAMGVDAARVGADGRLAIGIGNFANEATSYYRQLGEPWLFAETSSAQGIGSPSRLKLSFGLFFFDADHDGHLDMLQANGHLEDEINEVQPSQHYRQPAQLFWNRAGRTGAPFAALDAEAIGDLATPIVGRAATHADIDGDGDVDVLLTQAGGPPLLLRNDRKATSHWLRVRVVGTPPNTDAIGAEVEIVAADGHDLEPVDAPPVVQRRSVMPTKSYLAQTELTVDFGLGASVAPPTVRVRWPDGSEREIAAPGVDRTIVVEPPR